MLGRHEEELSAARNAVESLAAQVNDLSVRLLHAHQESPVVPSHSSLPEPRVNNPPCYAGEPTECRAFLTQCEVAFSLQPQTYAGDRARIAYVISLLTGRAREWGTSVWEAGTPCCHRFDLFKEEMIKIFDQSVFGHEASHLLTTIRQGVENSGRFAIEFRTLSTTSEWNEPALVARFLEGLNVDLKEEIYARGSPAQLDQLIELAIRLDRCFEQRRRARAASATLREPSFSVTSRPDPEPMQLGSIRLLPDDRQRRISNRLCLYCGAAGHFAASCPVKARARQ
ncbi:hypothetical protein PO909_028745 [Leuciscus waleckii]